ncbi:MAG: hypothetical protein ABR923_06580 [Terracidiphilus sp.]
MRGVSPWPVSVFIAALFTLVSPLRGQQGPDVFHWVDFHSQQDQSVVVWVNRSLDPEKWTAIREIGVEYDAALVVTTLRATPQSPANADTFTVWSVSLTTHAISPILKGVNLRWLDWMTFLEAAPAEPTAIYDNCTDCTPATYFTAFHYDTPQHMWTARWLRGGQGVPLWSPNSAQGVELTQIDAVLNDLDGHPFICTWNHFDYGKAKPADDFIYRFDLDPVTRLERTAVISGKDADPIKLRLCRAPATASGLARGQDSAVCQQLIKPRVERRPVTTPPANNHGQSVPPGAHH